MTLPKHIEMFPSAKTLLERKAKRTNTMTDQTIITLNFHNDGGHGWLECGRELVTSAGIASDISGYSYQRGNNVYLEEDCDMPLLFNALRKRNIAVVVNDIYQDESPVREYARYTK